MLAIAALLGVAACGGTTTSTTGPASDAATLDAPAADAALGDAAAGRIPSDHRPAGMTCTPTVLPPEPEIPDAGFGPSATFECRIHEDCTAKPAGRCVVIPANLPEQGGTRCIYDECTVDADCPSGGVCVCGDVANTCLASACRIDSDCGRGGYCSPYTPPCGTGVAGYACHASTDVCVNDSDCAGTAGLTPTVCTYDTAAGAWKCMITGCGAAQAP
jgi:hypothetical protein